VAGEKESSASSPTRRGGKHCNVTGGVKKDVRESSLWRSLIHLPDISSCPIVGCEGIVLEKSGSMVSDSLAWAEKEALPLSGPRTFPRRK